MKTKPKSAKKVPQVDPKPALEKGSIQKKAVLSKISGDKDESKPVTSTATVYKIPKIPQTKPAKMLPQEGTKTMETKPTSAIKKVPQGDPKPAYKIPKIPKTKSAPAKMLPQEGTKTTETKPTSAIKKVPQGDPKPGASILKDSTQFRENVRSGKGISAPKEQAKKRKAPEEKNALNNKIRKSNSTHPPSDVNDGGSATVNASDSAIVRDNKVTGQEVNFNFF
ncbi:uncharacterized protein LOC105441543 [Strongylocentrotus purpuratus]|uniref:Uncharacterized protein n=1 Tax=Strongylocentrotus purpuratus TaxID=7668 RepID=A0A7M7NHS1_STRPU|nr:uncharacterized protein LOC105441543 [Strongylocentrotus purpuratus]